MSNKEMEQLLARVHKEITLFPFKKLQIPCIVYSERKFDEILAKVAGRPISIDTNLNILQDGLGHVFVEILLTFSIGDISEKVLLYANDCIEFFENLAETSMLALSSERSADKIFMIQLPKPEKAVNALKIIKKGLQNLKNKS